MSYIYMLLFQLTKGSSSLQDSEIDDLDNPKHRYYLKVCYICKETTTKEHCIHYGALACFSCRAFFRRSHQGMQDKGLADDGKRKLPEFICKKSGNCNVTPKTRRRCQKCRYELCIKAGMQPDAVMTDDAVKVRFRKMFTKRAGTTNTADNDATETYDDEHDLMGSLGNSEQEHSTQAYTQEPSPVSFAPQKQYTGPEMIANVPQRYAGVAHNLNQMNVPHFVEERLATRLMPTNEHPNAQYASRLDDPGMIPSNLQHTTNGNEIEKRPVLESKDISGSFFHNITKKQRILGSLGIDGFKKFSQSNFETLEEKETQIKQEYVDPIDLQTDFISQYHKNDQEPELEKYVKKEVDSPLLDTSQSPESTLPLVLDAENYRSSQNDTDFLSINNNDMKILKAATENENNILSENSIQTSSNMNDGSEQGDVGILTKIVNQDTGFLADEESDILDVQNRIDCIEKGIHDNNTCNDTIVKSERTASPELFKSPSLSIIRSKKVWRCKRKLQPYAGGSKPLFNISAPSMQPCQDHTGSSTDKNYHKIRKRISDLMKCYKIASSQLAFPDDLVNKLINFHVGCASADKENFLCWASTSVRKAINEINFDII